MPSRQLDYSQELLDRIWSKIVIPGEYCCWGWTGTPNSEGYGQVKWKRNRDYVHRIIWTIHHGLRIPDEYNVVQICRNRVCCNPAHLLLRHKGRIPNTIEDVLLKLVLQEYGCLEWPGYLDEDGYGKVKINGRDWRVHRLIWEYYNGAIPAELQIDHICKNRKCSKLEHLQLLTVTENVLRSECPGAKNAKKTHCLRGHPLSGENLYISPGRKGRHCRICKDEATRRYQERQRVLRR